MHTRSLARHGAVFLMGALAATALAQRGRRDDPDDGVAYVAEALPPYPGPPVGWGGLPAPERPGLYKRLAVPAAERPPGAPPPAGPRTCPDPDAVVPALAKVQRE